MAPRKKKDEREGGVRVDKASDKPGRARVAAGQPATASTGAPGPTWLNPKEPLPASVTESLLAASEARGKPMPPPTPVERALAAIGDKYEPTPQVLAAVILSQALDRLGEKMVQAAAVSRYRGT